MKYCFDGVIVVEGKDDVAFLSSFINSLYVTTRGNVIPTEELDFLNHLNDKKIIVLTDSDQAGDKIRERLNKLLSNSINIRLDSISRKQKGKHGVAETTKEEVLNKLKPYLLTNIDKKENITLLDISKAGIKDKESRKRVCELLHLGLCNNKTMIERMNFKGIKIEDLEKLEGKHGNK